MAKAASEAGAPTPILQGEGLVRSFRLGSRRVDVLLDAAITVHEGEFLAVVGLSGVGKSTLLHILGALDRPDAGALRFRGRDMLAMAETDLAKLRNTSLGFVFQFHHLLPEFNAIENVMMPARILGRSRGESRRMAERLLVQVGLADRLDHRPAELSGGEQQRLAVARALVNGPDLLLADEPSGNLDPRTGQMIYDLLFELRETLGQSIAVTTHSAELAGQCDRVLELRDGRLHPPREGGPRREQWESRA